MKTLIFITFIFCFLTGPLAYAGFMSKAKLLDCEGSDRVFYLKLKGCTKLYADCVKVPTKFICDTFSELDTEVDDLEKPKYTKIIIYGFISKYGS